MKKLVYLVACFALTHKLYGQDKPPSLTFSGYLETYYVYDFNKPPDHTRPTFVYSHNRHNQVNLNIGMLKAAFQKDRVRANLALMAGTYAIANLAAEPGILKNIYEANAGVKLSARKNLWIDAGIFTSHIGSESAIGKDCWTVTRSIQADNTPYYQAGAKITYTSDNKIWSASALILNGWQRMQRIKGSSIPSFGTQIIYKPSTKLTLNNSTFIGTDKPDSSRVMRYFNNLYGVLMLNSHLQLSSGFDFGLQQSAHQSSGLYAWYSVVAIVRYRINEMVSISGRLEYYDDAHNVIIQYSSPRGFQTSGFSLNLDYNISTAVVWRIEARELLSRNNVFIRDGKTVSNDVFASTALAIKF